MIRVKKRRLFLGRKAQATHEIMFTIFEMLVFAFFCYLLFAFVNGIDNNTTFEKNYLARDLAITTNTIYASPSSIVYKYPESLSVRIIRYLNGEKEESSETFYVKIEDNLVLVREKGDDESVAIKYWYAGESPDNPVVEKKFKDEAVIKFSKSFMDYSIDESLLYYDSIYGYSGSIDLTGSCGETLVSIAKQGLGHPYCMGSKEWDPSGLPSKEPNCVYGSHYSCEKGWWQSAIKQAGGRCTIDCSSFTKWVYNYYALHGGSKQFYIQERQAQWQAQNIGKVVDHNPMTDWGKYEKIKPDCNTLQKGDLIFFAYTYPGAPRPVSHVGMYIGDCKYIHAGGDPINEPSLNNEWAIRHYIGAKRVCPTGSSITGSVIEIDGVEYESEISSRGLELPYLNESCNTLGGISCLDNESCHGQSVISKDSELCCLEGECRWMFEAGELPEDLFPEEVKASWNLTWEEFLEKYEDQPESEEVIIDVEEDKSTTSIYNEENMMLASAILLIFIFLIIIFSNLIKNKKRKNEK